MHPDLVGPRRGSTQHERTVDVHIRRLRKVLERYGLAEHLRDDLCTSYARLLEDNDEPHLRKLIDIIDLVPESEFADPRDVPRPPTAPDDRDDEEDPA